MMTNEDLKRVEDSCLQVLESIQQVRDERTEFRRRDAQTYGPDIADDGSLRGTKTTGQLRRRSLDLTRALADLRRP